MKKIVALLLVIIVFTFTACGYSEEELAAAEYAAYEAGYNAGYRSGYEEGYTEGHDVGYEAGYSELKPLSMPSSGSILYGKEYDESEITITASGEASYVVSLKNFKKRCLLSFFVRAGETVTVGVPAEYLWVHFASGNTWYGYGEGLMFGENTVYSKDDGLTNFTNSSWEYTLYPVYNGNFTETPSSESEFF